MAGFHWTNEPIKTETVPVCGFDDLHLGDQICFSRVRGTYYHHALILGIQQHSSERGNIWVIENNKGADKRIVENMKDIDLSKDKIFRVDYLRVSDPYCLYSADDVITRAKTRMQMNHDQRTYDLMNNNCEHFARWCKTGDDTSDQVERKLPFLRSLAMTMVKRIAEICASVDVRDAVNAADNFRPWLKALVEEFCRDLGPQLVSLMIAVGLAIYAIYMARMKLQVNVLTDAEYCDEIWKIIVENGGAMFGLLVGSLVCAALFSFGFIAVESIAFTRILCNFCGSYILSGGAVGALSRLYRWALGVSERASSSVHMRIGAMYSTST